MKLLAELHDKDVGIKLKKQKETMKRMAARAVLMKGNKVALLYVSKDKYHKLPGGGVEKNETIEDALFREMLEETGCKIKIIGEIGKIIEHRPRSELVNNTNADLVQTSYCYLAEVVEEGEPNFDEGEKKVGYKLEWFSLENAIKLIEKENPTANDCKFIITRDRIILKSAQQILIKKL